MGIRTRSWLVWGAVAALGGGSAWLWMDSGPKTDDGAGERAAGQLTAPPGGGVPLPIIAAGPAPSTGATQPVAPAARFKLAGVMTHGGEGVALIAVDGNPARMFRIGDSVSGNLLLRGITSEGAVLGSGDGGASIALKSSPLPTPAQMAPPPEAEAGVNRDLSDGSVESESALRRMGARNAPLKAPTAADQASAAQASVPTDPGRWLPPGQP